VALKRYLDRLRSWWVALIPIAAAIVAFYKGVGTVVEATSAIVGTTADVWARWGSAQFGIVLTILMGTVVLLVVIWWQEVFPAVAICWRKSTTRGVIKTGASVTLLVGIAATVTVLLLHDVEPEHLRALFAQAETLNAIALRTYGTDGRAEYEIMRSKDATGPRAFARVTLAPWKDTAQSNCGFIISFQPGTDLHRFTRLHFMLRGRDGNEKVDIKAKDATGNEVRIRLEGSPFVPDGRIAQTWKEVAIPLTSFGSVRFGFFDNLSFSVSGDRAGASPQIIDVGGFEFRKDAPAS
jgi:hypothetical protein